jgi:hypothetical protein
MCVVKDNDLCIQNLGIINSYASSSLLLALIFIQRIYKEQAVIAILALANESSHSLLNRPSA